MSELAELLGVIRDVILILTFTVLFALVLGLLVVYRKLSRLLESTRRMVSSAEQVADAISSKIVGPAASGSGVAYGLGKVAAFLKGFRRKSKKKGGEKDGG